MSQDKILKCCKMLEKFNLDEVIVMTGLDEVIVIAQINDLLSKDILKKLNDSDFLFIKNGYKDKNENILKKNDAPVKPLSRCKTQRYKNGDALYEEYKKLYFSDFTLNKSDCYKKLKDKHCSSEDLYSSEFPSNIFFSKKLNEEYGKEELNKIRESTIISLENTPFCTISSDSFYSGAKKYLENKKIKFSENKYYQVTNIIFNRYILPSFSNFKVSDIKTIDILNFCDQKLNEGLHLRFLKKHLVFIKNVLEYENPNFVNNFRLINTKLRSYSLLDQELNILNESKINQLLKIAYSNDYEFYLLVSFMLSTGMFLDEVLGLWWRHINFKNNRVMIKGKYKNRQILKIRYDKRSLILKIPDYLLNLLYKKKLLINKQNRKLCNSFIFYQNRNEDLEKDLQEKLIKFSNDKNISFLDLRDTYASKLIKNNVPLHYVQKLLGHSHIEYTLQRYKKFLDQLIKEQDNSFSAFIEI